MSHHNGRMFGINYDFRFGWGRETRDGIKKTRMEFQINSQIFHEQIGICSYHKQVQFGQRKMKLMTI